MFSFAIVLKLFQKHFLITRILLDTPLVKFWSVEDRKNTKCKVDIFQKPMSIWLRRLQRDDSAFFLYILNTLFSCVENETNLFFITPKLSQKHPLNKIDTFRYLRCLIWTRRSWGKRENKILRTSESSSPFGWGDFKETILTFSFTPWKHCFPGLKTKQIHSLLTQNFLKNILQIK